jgi:hypothetical protein
LIDQRKILRLWSRDGYDGDGGNDSRRRSSDSLGSLLLVVADQWFFPI